MEIFSNAIYFGLQRLLYKEIKDNQKKVIEAYLQGKDVFFCSPTGTGKSLTFEIAPFVFAYMQKDDQGFRNPVIIVISPLTALMRSQVGRLRQKGINAVYLRDVFETKSLDEEFSNLTMNDIRDGKIDLIFASPESLLGQQRELLLSLSKKKLIKALFVDEAHCIKKFGKTDKISKKPPYRPCYGKLGEIRSLIGGKIPVISLTATATKETKEVIIKDLCMENCVEIIANPDKKNITYWVHTLDSDDISINFQWLVDLLRKEKNETTRMIIFFRQIKQISEVYELLETSLGRDAYINYKEEGPNDDRNRLFDMFHMKTDDDVKDTICSSYQDPCGNIRVVLCSTSFSMGLDVKGVDVVIHYGPANDADDYIQESGRAGRDLSHDCHAIIFKYKRCLGSRNISDSMKHYVATKTCRRKFLLSSFETCPKSREPAHLCCDNCRQTCECNCTCEQDCKCTQTCLASPPTIYSAITSTSTTLSDLESSHSSSDTDIDLLAKKPQVIYSSSDEDLFY